jgi:hypothetical protein
MPGKPIRGAIRPLRRLKALLLPISLIALCGAVALSIPVLWLELDEAAIPPRSSVGPLPEGAQASAPDKGCGSGGCWIEVTVTAPAGLSGAELAAEVLPDGPSCAFRSVVDLRRVCTEIESVDADSATFSAMYWRLLGQ